VSELDYKPGRRKISIYKYQSHILGEEKKIAAFASPWNAGARLSAMVVNEEA
jgi:hypothetical protein